MDAGTNDLEVAPLEAVPSWGAALVAVDSVVPWGGEQAAGELAVPHLGVVLAEMVKEACLRNV